MVIGKLLQSDRFTITVFRSDGDVPAVVPTIVFKHGIKSFELYVGGK
jgi:hypothetical protein